MSPPAVSAVICALDWSDAKRPEINPDFVAACELPETAPPADGSSSQPDPLNSSRSRLVSLLPWVTRPELATLPRHARSVNDADPVRALERPTPVVGSRWHPLKRGLDRNDHVQRRQLGRPAKFTGVARGV